MREQMNACKALAAMVRDHGTVNRAETQFVAQTALELGLDEESNKQVQSVLADGGDFGALLGEVNSRPLRVFLFRRIVTAALVDDRISDGERSFINTAAAKFDFNKPAVDDFIAWVRDGIAWEKRGAELADKL